MSDYGFVHEGRVFTPNGTPGVTAEENADRNKAIESAELGAWMEQPDRMLAYYSFPAEQIANNERAAAGVNLWRSSFRPALYSNLGTIGTKDQAYVSTWLGTKIGVIISARVYTHNFGGRFVSLTVRGTNGASYYGRASYDNGSCVWLRKARS